MAKSLIFIHGRSQHGRSESEILQEWRESLTLGLGVRAKRFFDETDIKLPFYGDVLEDFNRQLESELPADIVMRGTIDGVDNEFLQFSSDILSGLQAKLKISDEQIAAHSRGNAIERGPLNWGWIQQLLKAADDIPGVSTVAIERFTRDVFVYLTRTKVRKHINGMIGASFIGNPAVVVGHSLGSVVGYDAIRNLPGSSVSHYITLGSPLGIGPVMRVLHPIVFPPNLLSWYNAYDDRDVVALNPLDGKFFPISGGVIENFGGVANRTENAHHISGYLSDPIVASTIYKAVIG
ncbi:hypothetical protein ACU8L5_35875 (plasmid) [Rhizobium leguminosarum]|jgi:hypothetical protein